MQVVSTVPAVMALPRCEMHRAPANLWPERLACAHRGQQVSRGDAGQLVHLQQWRWQQLQMSAACKSGAMLQRAPLCCPSRSPAVPWRRFLGDCSIRSRRPATPHQQSATVGREANRHQQLHNNIAVAKPSAAAAVAASTSSASFCSVRLAASTTRLLLLARSSLMLQRRVAC